MDDIPIATRPVGSPRITLTRQDCDLLVALINHRRQSDVTAALGYSDRHLRRLIRALLCRLEVPTTHAAVALAIAAGHLEAGRHHSRERS